MIKGEKLGFREAPATHFDRLGPQATYIISTLGQEWTNRFIEASLHYGDGNADVLGVRGQFADIWRKIGPLKRALWEGEELTREQPREILMDLIGHCMLTIAMLDKQAERSLAQDANNFPGHTQ